MTDIDFPDPQTGIEVSSGAHQVDSGRNLHLQGYEPDTDHHQEGIVMERGQEKIGIEKENATEKGVKNAEEDLALEVIEIPGKIRSKHVL